MTPKNRGPRSPLSGNRAFNLSFFLTATASDESRSGNPVARWRNYTWTTAFTVPVEWRSGRDTLEQLVA